MCVCALEYVFVRAHVPPFQGATPVLAGGYPSPRRGTLVLEGRGTPEQGFSQAQVLSVPFLSYHIKDCRYLTRYETIFSKYLTSLTYPVLMCTMPVIRVTRCVCNSSEWLTQSVSRPSMFMARSVKRYSKSMTWCAPRGPERLRILEAEAVYLWSVSIFSLISDSMH